MMSKRLPSFHHAFYHDQLLNNNNNNNINDDDNNNYGDYFSNINVVASE